ncbi:MAG: MotA/TolQ/ExbB proton channel family protein [Limnochordia bacterium]|jgi:biopolymer transport protein ExbB
MLELIIKGGPVMIPLILTSIVSFGFALERFHYIRRAWRDHGALMDIVEARLDEGNLGLGREACVSWGGPVANVLASGLAHFQSGIKDPEKAMEETQRLEFLRLEKHLDILALAANLAPLLGLLGTITGMIDTFDVYSRHGSANPGLLARGISEALITTACGLLIAIANVAIHHYLTRQVDQLMEETDAYGTKLSDLLAERVNPGV